MANDMFEPWCLGRWTRLSEPMPRGWGCATLTDRLADQDLLRPDSAYELRDTGQGLHRVQPAPRTSRAMQQLLHLTQARSRRDDAEIAWQPVISSALRAGEDARRVGGLLAHTSRRLECTQRAHVHQQVLAGAPDSEAT